MITPEKLDNHVKQVSVSLNGNFQNVEIVKLGGNTFMIQGH